MLTQVKIYKVLGHFLWEGFYTHMSIVYYSKRGGIDEAFSNLWTQITGWKGWFDIELHYSRSTPQKFNPLVCTACGANSHQHVIDSQEMNPAYNFTGNVQHIKKPQILLCHSSAVPVIMMFKSRNWDKADKFGWTRCNVCSKGTFPEQAEKHHIDKLSFGQCEVLFCHLRCTNKKGNFCKDTDLSIKTNA